MDKLEQYKLLESMNQDVILDYVWENYYDWVMSQGDDERCNNPSDSYMDMD